MILPAVWAARLLAARLGPPDCPICAPTVARLNAPALPASSPVEARDGGPGTPVPGSPLKPGGSPIALGEEARRLISST